MEIQNNHQLVKHNRRVCFHYRSEAHSSPKGEKDPATINSYSISGNDLILTHEKYYGRNFDATDSLRDWKLINVDKQDCAPDKLTRLRFDDQIEEIKIIET